MGKTVVLEKIDLSRDFRDYTKKTSTRNVRYENLYISPKRLVKGNTKLYNILIFDLPAVKSCLNCSSCASSCYAVKAQRQYVDTRIFRDTNLHLFLHNKELLFDLIVEQLSNTKVTTVRLHSSGDFFSQSYIDMWDKIIGMFPNIKFYSYTKVEKLLDFSNIEKHKNFNLILSFIEGNLNYGSIEYCKELNAKYGTFICPVTNGVKDIKCGKGCNYCISNKNVCFVEH